MGWTIPKLTFEKGFPYDLELLEKCCEKYMTEKWNSGFYSQALLEYMRITEALAVVPRAINRAIRFKAELRGELPTDDLNNPLYRFYMSINKRNLARILSKAIACEGLKIRILTDLVQEAYPSENFEGIQIVNLPESNESSAPRSIPYVAFFEEKERDLIKFLQENSELRLPCKSR